MAKKELRRIDISKIENPEFLHELNYKELNLLCKDIRERIVQVTSKNGGHLSSNLGSVESTVSLCHSFDFKKDKIIFDVGHQCYTYKILTGRNLDGLRTKDGPSGFQKMSESPYDHFEAGHSSTSISVANGMAIARDLNKEKYDVIAYIGDGSIVNGLALEGLNLSTQENHKIIIVFNDNDMSISKPVGALSRAFRRISSSVLYNKSKSAIAKIFGKKISSVLSKFKNWVKRHLVAINLFDLFDYAVIGPVDGHDIKAMDKAFAKAKKINRSVVVHIKTIKGYGYEYAEKDEEGIWHGVGKFNIESGEAIKGKKLTWSCVYEKYLNPVMEKHEDAVMIVPATELGSHLSSIFEKYRDRTIDVGIAEEHAVTMSGGLSVSGKHPIISIYSTFLQRSYDEVLHDLARMNLSATFLVDRSGLSGEDGDTHQGIYDEAFILSIPNTIIAMATNEEEAEYLLEESFNHNAPFFIRYPKENVNEYKKNNTKYEFGKWNMIKESKNKDKAIISVGPITRKLESLIDKNNIDIDVTLVNALFISPMDNSMIDALLSYKTIIIYNAYATTEGFVRKLESVLLEKKYQGNVIVRAVPNTFVKHASIDEQRKEFSLDVESIKNLLIKS